MWFVKMVNTRLNWIFHQSFIRKQLKQFKLNYIPLVEKNYKTEELYLLFVFLLLHVGYLFIVLQL